MAVKTNKLLLRDDNTGLVRDIKQDFQDAAGDKASYYFTNAGINYISSAATSATAIANTDFTLVISGLLKKKNLEQDLSQSTIDANNFMSLYLNSSNTLIFSQKGNGTITTATFASTIEDGTQQTIILTRTSNATNSILKLYINGTLRDTQTTSLMTPLVGNFPFYVGANTSTSIKDGSINRFIFLNTVISIGKIAAYSQGRKLDYEDLGGSMVNKVVNGDTFSSGWTVAGGTGSSVSGGVATIGYGLDVSLRQTNAAWISGYTIGKKYKLTYTVVSNSLVGGTFFELCTSYWTSFLPLYLATVTLPSTPGTYSVEFTCDNPNAITQIWLGMRGTTTAGALVLDNINIIQIGAMVAMEPENIFTTRWIDSSGNGLYGTVNGAVPVNNKDAFSVVVDAVTTTFAGSTISTSAAALSLPAGRYHVSGSLPWYIASYPTGTGSLLGSIRLYNLTDNADIESQFVTRMSAGGATAGELNNGGNTISTIITLTKTTTIQLRLGLEINSPTPTGGAIATRAGMCNFTAKAL